MIPQPLPFYEHKTEIIQGGTWYGDGSFPPHLHTAPEMYRVNRGTLRVQLNTREYLATAGQLVIVFPNVIHAFQLEDRDTQVDLLICGPDSGNGFPKKMSNRILSNPVLPFSELHPDVNYMFSRLIEEAQGNRNTQLINAYFQIFWLKLLPSLTLTESMHPAVPDLVTNLILYITEHFCEPISLQLLSKELGVCRFYLSRVFTQVLHIGFRTYVNTLRVNHAQKLLLNKEIRILDIAIECGFQNQQTFNRVFKEICGITPAQYRKQMTGPGKE